MVLARSTFWLGPKCSNLSPWIRDPDWDPDQCPRLVFWTGTLSLNPVRSRQTQRSTSRPQMMSKSDLILSKSLFLAQLRYGDTAVWHCLVLFPFPPPRLTPLQPQKDKTPAHFSFTVCVDLRSESSWLEPSESPSPLSLVPTAAHWRQPTGHRWLWPYQTDSHTGSPSSGQFSPAPESPPPAVYIRTERRRRQRLKRQKAELYAQTKGQTVIFRLPIYCTEKTLAAVNKRGDKYCEHKLHGLKHANKHKVVRMEPIITSQRHGTHTNRGTNHALKSPHATTRPQGIFMISCTKYTWLFSSQRK